MPDFYTPNQIADMLQLSRDTIMRLIDRGELPAAKIGKQWRISASDLQTYIASKKTKTQVSIE